MSRDVHADIDLSRVRQVEAKPDRNKFRNWFLQFVGVQQEPPFASTSQSTVTLCHPTTLLSPKKLSKSTTRTGQRRCHSTANENAQKRLTDPFQDEYNEDRRFRAKCTSLTAVAVRAALYLAGWAYEMENITFIVPGKR